MISEHCPFLYFLFFVVCIFPPCFCPKIYANSPAPLDILQIPSNVLQRTKKEPENYLTSRLNSEKYLPTNSPTKSDSKVTPQWGIFHPPSESFLNGKHERTTYKKKLQKGLILRALERLREFFKKLFGLSAKNKRKAQKASRKIPLAPQNEKTTSTRSDPTPLPKQIPPARDEVPKKGRSESGKPPEGIAAEQYAPEASTYWFGRLWNWLTDRYNKFRGTPAATDKSTSNKPHGKSDRVSTSQWKKSIDDHNDNEPKNDSKLKGRVNDGNDAQITENVRLNIQRTLATKESIPEATVETTFMFADLIFEVLRNKMAPSTAVAEIMDPFITSWSIYGKVFKYANSEFSKKLLERFAPSQDEIQSELMKYKSWYHFMSDEDRSLILVDVYLSTIRACVELSTKLVKHKWFGYDSVKISKDFRAYTKALSEKNRDEKSLGSNE